MFGHIPFGDVELVAVRAFEWLLTSVLPHMDFKVTSCVVFLLAPWHGATKLILVVMGPLVVSQNPLLSEFFVATLKRTGEFDYFALVVSG